MSLPALTPNALSEFGQKARLTGESKLYILGPNGKKHPVYDILIGMDPSGESHFVLIPNLDEEATLSGIVSGRT